MLRRCRANISTAGCPFILEPRGRRGELLAPMPPSSTTFMQGLGGTLLSGGEIELSSVCTNESDSMILRNILYTIWATNRPGKAGSHATSTCYLVRVRLLPCWKQKVPWMHPNATFLGQKVQLLPLHCRASLNGGKYTPYRHI
jgi:hypothetical protein